MGIDSNNSVIVKGKLDPKLDDAFKKILEKLKLTQQEFIETKVKEFVLDNIHLILTGDKK